MMVCASSIPGAWPILSFLKALRKKAWLGWPCRNDSPVSPKISINLGSGDSFYLFPMPLSEARITNNLQEWDVNFELVDLAFDAVSHSSWSWSISEGFGQFQHCPVHAANFLFNLFWVNVSKWPFWKQTEVEWLAVKTRWYPREDFCCMVKRLAKTANGT